MLTLMYHNIISQPIDDWPIAKGQVTLEDFSRQMRILRRNLLHPHDVHEQLLQGKLPKGILVTFDDGATGILDAGRVLSDLGTAGVAFICPGAFEDGVWFYRLADLLVRATATNLTWRDCSLPLASSAEKQLAYSRLSTLLFDLPAQVRDDYLQELRCLAQVTGDKPAPALTTLDLKGVRQVAGTNGMLFANHSWSHSNLTSLSPPELRTEIKMAEAWLESAGLPVLPWFAFPRGKYNASVLEMAQQACKFSFGAEPFTHNGAVLPRTAINNMDANRLRFALKTMLEGRLRLWLLPG